MIAVECHVAARGSRTSWRARRIEAASLLVYPPGLDIREPTIVMNVKISIELPESQIAFAERKVREGGYASVSEVIAETMRDAMWAEQDRANDDPVLAMKDEILRRLELPDDQWIVMDENDTMFEDLLRRADEQIKAGR
jgi:antitoxin ParD1/3/4